MMMICDDQYLTLSEFCCKTSQSEPSKVTSKNEAFLNQLIDSMIHAQIQRNLHRLHQLYQQQYSCLDSHVIIECTCTLHINILPTFQLTDNKKF